MQGIAGLLNAFGKCIKALFSPTHPPIHLSSHPCLGNLAAASGLKKFI